MKVYGYASVFDKLDLTNDITIKGCFDATIDDYKKRDKNIPVLFNHDTSTIIGIVKEIYEDRKGLFVCIELFEDDFKVKNIQKWYKNKIQLGFSIGFDIKEIYFDDNVNRVLKVVKLIEISILLNPANKFTLIDKIEE